jgi:hypothetical protein
MNIRDVIKQGLIDIGEQRECVVLPLSEKLIGLSEIVVLIGETSTLDSVTDKILTVIDPIHTIWGVM